jgi:SAM-dependent methyltransferase
LERHADGSAGDADYGRIGAVYTDYRRPDPRILALIQEALGEAESVLNVGAGAGGYEPRTRRVTAVEPSATMRARRPADLPPAIDAVAEALPFADCSFDAAMATFSVHQWPDLGRGLAEMRRVTRGPVVILTCDPLLVERFWLADYAPEVLAVEARRYPALDLIAVALGNGSVIQPAPVPFDCTDGFQEAYYGRPEMFLDRAARLACSAWSFVGPEVESRLEQTLGADLESGAWDAAHGRLRRQAVFDGSLRLVIGRP